MIIVYTISTGTFEPISFGTNYLYSQYDKIQSFLIKNYLQKYKNILAKPILSGTDVNWFGNFNKPLSRLSDLSQEIQEKIKIEYWNAQKQIINDIKSLEYSKETEKKNWAKLLKEVFNDDNNIILSDGVDWCLLWGWQFKNKQENYLAPSFLPNVIPVEEVASINNDSIEVSPVIVNGAIPSDIPQDEPEIIQLPIEEDKPTAEIINQKKVKPTIWDKIKSFFRRLVYRIWGLLLIIMIVLFIMCLLKYCSNENISESCSEMEKVNLRLMDLDKKVKERCDQSQK